MVVGPRTVVYAGATNARIKKGLVFLIYQIIEEYGRYKRK